MIRIHLFFISILLFGAAIAGENTLYGISSGSKISDVIKTYGEPSQTIPFEDGWIAYAFQLSKHNLIVETSANESELISTVQVAGYENPKGRGLNGIDLGANTNQVVTTFGRPEEKRESFDSKTREKIANAFIYQYQTFSFEIINDKVTSIKLHFPSQLSQLLSSSVIKPDGLLQYTYNNLYQMVIDDHQCTQLKLLTISEGKMNNKGVITEKWDIDACGKKITYFPILVPDSQNGYLVSFGQP